ncbi:MAG: TolC family protein [Thermodesulfobacteriota bacterium]
MKRGFPPGWRAIVLALAMVVLPAVAAAGEDEVPARWTAEAAVRFALAHSPDARIGQARIAAAQAAIAAERAAFFPRLDVNSLYSQTTIPMLSFGNILNQGKFHQGIDFNHPGQTDNLNLGVRLSYRLFSGGRDWAGLDAAQAQELAARMERASVDAQLAFEVVRAFNLVLQQEGMIRAQQAATEATGAALAVAQARHAEGVLLKADLLDLEVQHARARENLVQARHALTVGQRIFLHLLGLAGGEVVLEPQGGAQQGAPPDRSPERRPELQGVEALIRAAQNRVRQATAGYYPTVDGYAGYGVDKGYELDGSGDAWEAGVRVQLNLFNGRQTSAEVARASAMLLEAQERKRKVELAIALEVQQAEAAWQEAQERLEVSSKSVEQAQESARINRLRFGEGVVLAADLIAVENRLTEAMVRRTVAETARRIALADLRRALGLPQFEEAGPAGGVSQ